ncbi:CHASE3 domain-containing protein [Agaribacterium sp. ZY112]|uniref:CHASE3 domain-containing protein n=1 Tax=Agaribacterium sp. ZY112 TaxID=3233574 RepID=UPI003523C096
MLNLMPRSIRFKILTGFMFPLILIGAFSVFIHHTVKSSIETANWVSYSQEVITRAHKLEKYIVAMETGERGFLITGKEHFLEPFIASRQKWALEIEALKSLVAKRSEQLARINEIERMANMWVLAIAEPDIKFRRSISNGNQASIELLMDGEEGKRIMDEMRFVIERFIQEEEALMQARALAARDKAELTVDVTSLWLPLLALLGAAVAVFTLFKAIIGPLRSLSEAAEQIADGDLNARIDNVSDDEIGFVAQSFNDMASSLHASITANEEANRRLLHAHKDLENKAEELLLASQHKSQFLANMSHEIRTPLNGVMGMLGLISRSEINEKTKRYTSLALESAESLLVVINDILDFSKIEAGKLEVEAVEFDIRLLFSDFSHAVAYRAQEKGLEFVVDIFDLPAGKFYGDAARIRQILNNLVNNAIKFTKSGEIVVRAELAPVEDKHVELRCSVSDTGIGIAADKLATLFQEFTQEDASTTRDYGGTGLGLAIVKQLCCLMGGDVWVGSIKGRGSEFSFSLLLECGQEQAVPAPCLDLSQQLVLLAEPNETHAELLHKQLESWQAPIRRTCEPQQMQAYLAATDLAISVLIISEKLLADMDSMQLKDMQSLCLARKVKVLLLSSLSKYDEKQRDFNGLDLHSLAKPISSSDLFDALNSLLYGKESTKKQAKTSLFAEGLSETEDIRVLLVEDNAFNQEVALGFLEDLNLSVGVANNGQEAIEELISAAESVPYSIVLMDCQMPVMDGYEATKSIRTGYSGVPNADIPIIAMTANAMRGDREKCLAAGMSDYLAKPVSFDGLLEKLSEWGASARMVSSRIVPVSSQELNADSSQVWVAADEHKPAAELNVMKASVAQVSIEGPSVSELSSVALNRREPSHSGGKQAESEEDEAPVDKHWDEELFLSRIKYKRDRAERLVATFMQSTPEILEDLKNSRDKGAELKAHAHKLKGASVNISAPHLAGLCAELETLALNAEVAVLDALLQKIEQAYVHLADAFMRWMR